MALCCGGIASTRPPSVLDDDPPSTPHAGGGWAGEAAYVEELRRRFSEFGEAVEPAWERTSMVNTSYAGGCCRPMQQSQAGGWLAALGGGAPRSARRLLLSPSGVPAAETCYLLVLALPPGRCPLHHSGCRAGSTTPLPLSSSLALVCVSLPPRRRRAGSREQNAAGRPAGYAAAQPDDL